MDMENLCKSLSSPNCSMASSFKVLVKASLKQGKRFKDGLHPVRLKRKCYQKQPWNNIITGQFFKIVHHAYQPLQFTVHDCSSSFSCPLKEYGAPFSNQERPLRLYRGLRLSNWRLKLASFPPRWKFRANMERYRPCVSHASTKRE